MGAAMRILRLNKSGYPHSWISREEAATLLVKDAVVWSLGDRASVIYGGINCAGLRSVLYLPSIIASEGQVVNYDGIPPLYNSLLLRRDQRCMYCGIELSRHTITRDHVIPRCAGGRDCWTNAVACCRRCNHHKGGRTPEEAGMSLLAIPFTPNTFEAFYLSNSRIRADQMEYLKVRFSGRRQWACAA